MPDVEWTTDWPRKPGFFWFYGERWKGLQDEMSLYCVEALRKKSGGKLIYATTGSPIEKRQVGACRWAKIEPPTLPTDLVSNG